MSEKIDPPARYGTYTKGAALWKHCYLAPEWLAGHVASWLSKRYLVSALEYIAKLGLLAGLLLWFYPGCQQRKQATKEAKQAADDARKAKHYVAWQTLNSAVGKPGGAGRSDALEDLNRDGVYLTSVDLSGAEFYQPFSVTNGRMNFANLTDTHFTKSCFSGTDMRHATLSRTRFIYCDMRGVNLNQGDLSSVWAQHADFSCLNDGGTNGITNLRKAQIGNKEQGTGIFRFCSFVRADLSQSDWGAGVVEACNFAHANLTEAQLRNTNATFNWCNFYGVTNAPPYFLKWATNHNAVFVDVTNHDDWLRWLAKAPDSPK